MAAPGLLSSPSSCLPNPWTVGLRCTCPIEPRPAVGRRSVRRQDAPRPTRASDSKSGQSHTSTPAPGSTDNGFVPQQERPRSADATDLQVFQFLLVRVLCSSSVKCNQALSPTWSCGSSANEMQLPNKPWRYLSTRRPAPAPPVLSPFLLLTQHPPYHCVDSPKLLPCRHIPPSTA